MDHRPWTVLTVGRGLPAPVFIIGGPGSMARPGACDGRAGVDALVQPAVWSLPAPAFIRGGPGKFKLLYCPDYAR